MTYKYSQEEEMRLVRLAQQGCTKSQNLLIVDNLERITKLANKYSRTWVPSSDLVNEGVIAFIQSIPGFDANNTHRFYTYACHKIKGRMIDTYYSSTAILSVTPSVLRKAYKLYATIKRLEAELSRFPTDAEIQEHTGILPRQLANLRRVYKQTNTVDADELGDLHAPKKHAPYNTLEELQRLQALTKSMSTLPERERALIEARYGFYGSEEVTFKDLGARLGVSESRAHQILNKGMRIMRNQPSLQMAA